MVSISFLVDLLAIILMTNTILAISSLLNPKQQQSDDLCRLSQTLSLAAIHSCAGMLITLLLPYPL